MGKLQAVVCTHTAKKSAAAGCLMMMVTAFPARRRDFFGTKKQHAAVLFVSAARRRCAFPIRYPYCVRMFLWLFSYGIIQDFCRNGNFFRAVFFFRLKKIDGGLPISKRRSLSGEGHFCMLRYTMRTEMSAGETPEMRSACPRLRGRMRSSFSRASSRRPAI